MLLLISICGPAASAEPVVLTFCYGIDATRTKEYQLKEFEKQNPGIRVNTIELPADTGTQHDRYVTTLAAGDTSIDVMEVDIIWPAEFASARWLLPLNDFLTERKRRDFFPEALQAVTHQGKIYACPLRCNAGLIFYRKDLLKKEGLKPPTSWEDLVSTAAMLQKKYKIDGLIFQGNRYEGLVCNFLEHLWGSGVDVFDPEGRITVNSPEAVEALKFMQDLIYTYKVSPRAVVSYQEQDGLIAFTQGKAAFLRSWPYVYRLAEESPTVRGKAGMMPIPGHRGRRGSGTLGAWNIAISSFTRHPREAWKLVDFLTSKEAQVFAALQGGHLPAVRSAYEDERVAKEAPYMKMFYRINLEGKPRPVTPLYQKISSILQIQVHRALTREIEPVQALDEAARKIARVYGRYHLPIGK